MKSSALSFVFILFFHSALIQAQNLSKSTCGLNVPVTLYDLVDYNKSIPAENNLHTYLEKINAVFNQPYAKYSLRGITNRPIAAAHLQRIKQNNAARVITINYEYYSSKVNSLAYEEALLIWVLTHEMQHHINGDLHYDNKSAANNLAREILADERAGYAVGKVTNVDIDFFSETLPKILSSNKDSNTHPPSEYRVLAAQAGWIRAKLENQNEATFNSNKYVKYTSNNGTVTYAKQTSNKIGITIYNNYDIYIGEFNNSQRNGKGCYLYYEGNKQLPPTIYIGDWKNGDKDGEGTCYFKSGNIYKGKWKNSKRLGNGTFFWSNGDKYIGDWKDVKMDGEGTFYYKDGKIYRGKWKNGNKHGDGILYRGDDLIKAGCWQNDVYKGVSCN